MDFLLVFMSAVLLIVLFAVIVAVATATSTLGVVADDMNEDSK